MRVIGLCSGHDAAYAVLNNGVVVRHVELERFSRIKQDIGDSWALLNRTAPELIPGTSFVTHCLDTWNGGMPARYPNSWKEIQALPASFEVPGHHEAHAAHAFFSSPYERALVVTMDGGGREWIDGEEFVTAWTVWEGVGTKLTRKAVFPIEDIDIGGLWDMFTKRIFGLSVSSPGGNQAGTVMAMAALGHDKYPFKIPYHKQKEWRDTLPWLKWHAMAMADEQTSFDIAASLQTATIDFVHRAITSFIGNHDTLCLAGGVALNAVLVGSLMQWYRLHGRVFVPPVPADAGLAIGAAQWVWHQKLQMPRQPPLSPYLGHEYDEASIREALRHYPQLPIEQCDTEALLPRLEKGQVIGVFGGPSESGRRALGNRSLLASPFYPGIKDRINTIVKHRQWFRPFAPVMLEEHLGRWFQGARPNPYMSATFQWLPQVRYAVPAVVHGDGSGRVQTVTAQSHPWLYELLSAWYKRTQIPVLLNTSFNDREPIVETPTDALRCFERTQIDALYFYDAGILVNR